MIPRLPFALVLFAGAAIARPAEDYEWDEPPPKNERRAPEPEPARRLTVAPGQRGTLGTAAVQGAIRPHLPEVRFCFDRERQKRPDLAGRVHVRFLVSTTGQVIDAEVESSTVESPSVEGCLVAAVRRWSFPKPVGGTAIVVYPFSALAR